MATFFGGEQLANVIHLLGSVTSDSTIYTVPTGKYAKIEIYSVTRTLSFSATSGQVTLLDYSIGNALSSGPNKYIRHNTYVDGANTEHMEIFLYSAEDIFIDFFGAVSCEYNIKVFEYNLP